MKRDLLFFLLHNLSQAELRVEKVIVPKKTPASNSMENFPFEWSWRQDVKVTHAQQLQKKSQSGVRANAFLTPLKHNARRSRFLPASRSVPID